MSRGERSLIDGPAGPLEILLEGPSGATPSAFGVVCHPHPLQGGNMDNKVAYTLARALQDVGLPTLRFNYRGVGRSAGQYDEGRGETLDALAVAAWGAARWPGAPVWFAGFSFGGFVAINASRQQGAERVVVVAPAVGRLSTFKVDGPRCPWLLVQGDADEVIAPATVLDWAREQSPAPEIAVFPGVGHFFHGQLTGLRQRIVDYAHKAESPAG
jgi:alpha/beta superfamily hydrolase